MFIVVAGCHVNRCGRPTQDQKTAPNRALKPPIVGGKETAVGQREKG